MKSGDLLFSAIQFLFSAFLLLIGVALLIVCAIPLFYQHLLFFLAKGPSAILTIGAVFFALGALLLFLFSVMHRGQYYDVQLPSVKALVQSSLIQESTLRYLSSLDLSYPVDCEVLSLRNNRIFLSLLLPEIGKQQQKELLLQLKQDLPALFKEQFGYEKGVKLSLLFR